MSDIFEKFTGLNLSGDTYESEQRYRLVVAFITLILGFIFLPYSSAIWIITIIKLVHFLRAKEPKEK